MKRLLYLVLCLACLPILAQRTFKTYTFNFDNPETLTPSIMPSTIEAGAVGISTSSTPDGLVQIRFDQGESRIGAQIKNDNAADGMKPFLTFPGGVSMIVSVANRETTEIVNFRIPSSNRLGGVDISGTDPATSYAPLSVSTYTDGARYYQWQGSAFSLTLNNNGQPCSIRKISIDYLAEPMNLFTIASFTPSSGTVSSLEAVLLSFGSSVGRIDDSKIPTLSGRSGNVISGSVAKEDDSSVKISFGSVQPDIYTLTIPEGMVYDAADKYYNPSVTTVYNVGDVPSDALIARAEHLLAQTGVGYPKASSAERLALAALTPTSSTSDYNTAIANYIASTDIEMPATGYYYKMYAVSPNGRTFYLKYDGQQILITESASGAALFMATDNGGSYSFTTTDNKFIMLPGYAPGVTDAYSSDVNDISIAKFSDAEATFGLLSLSQGDHYAGVNCNYANLNIPSTDKSFTGQLTCAFSITQVADSEIPVPDVDWSADPADGSSVQQFTQVTLKLNPQSGATVSVGDRSQIQLYGTTGQGRSPQSVTESGQNEFVIRFADVQIGSYTLTIGKGAFTYPYTINGNNITASVQQIVLHYNVEASDDFQEDLMRKYTIFERDSHPADEAVKDTVLNHLAFYTYDTEFGADPTKEVHVVHYVSSNVVATGHFVVTTDPALPGASVAELRFDKPITLGSIPSGMYMVVVPVGAIGDKNYRDYLAGASIAKHDCHINSKNTNIYRTVDNNAPAPPVRPSDAVWAEANQALQKTGVGYPAANAQTRTNLSSLVSSHEGSDAVFTAAIQAYYEETSIELPAQGSWYKVNAVTANGNKLYLQTSGLLTSDASKAGAFNVSGSGNTLTFSTIDEKYLTIDGSVTESPAAGENSLILSRYPVSGDNAKATFGMISISGKKSGSDVTAQVNATSQTFTTGSSAVFTDGLTSAFLFGPTTEPLDPAATPVYTLSPAGGQVGGPQLEITLTFTNLEEVTLADQGKIKMIRNNEPLPLASITAKGKNAFVLKFEDLTPGNYTLQIGDGTFTFVYKSRTLNVPAIQATYSVADKVVPSSQTLEKAERVLAKTGIGYPVADSPARLELMRLMELKEGSDELFKAAIEAYLTDENIEKPANGKFYRITSRNQNESFPKYYFVLNGNKLKLQADAGQAAIFETMENADGTMTLATINEKYLTLPSNGECLSATYNQAIHNLALKRLSVEGVDAEETFGLISLSLNGNYSVLWFNSSMANIKDPSSTTSFGGYESSGFLFEEVDVSGIAMPDVEYTTIPGSNGVVETLEKVTVTFNTKNKVTLKDEDKIKLVSKDTNAQIKANSVSEVEGSANTFEIHFINTKAGGYNLNIAEGAFVVNFLGRVEPVQEINVSLWATKDVEIAYDFETFYNLAVAQPKEGEYISDTFLNNDFMLKADVPIALVPNAEPVVIKTSLGIEKAKGHFEKSTDSQMVRLILDNPLMPGDLKAGDIRVVIKKGTLCNEAYLQYLDAKEAISMSSCHINSEKIFHVSVDNEKAAQAIETVTVSGYDAPVYDLSGRKVNEKTVQTGVYVRDGKKYVVRRK